MSDNETFEIEIESPTASASLGSEEDSRVVDNAAEQQALQEQQQQDARGENQNLTRQQRHSKLKQRVGELTRKNARLQEKAQSAQANYEQLQQQFQQTQDTFYTQAWQNTRVVYNTLNANKKILEANLKYARERGDTEGENQISDQLTEVRGQIANLRANIPGIDKDDGAPVTPHGQVNTAPQQPQPQPQQQQQLSGAAKQWADSNAFMKTRTDLHGAVNAVHEILYKEGYDMEDPASFVELNKRLKAVLPQDVAQNLKDPSADVSPLDPEFEELLGSGEDDDPAPPTAPAAPGWTPPAQQQQQQPSQGVSAGTRNQGTPSTPGSRKVTLTQAEREYCARNDIDIKAYAASKVASQSDNGYTEIGG